MIKRLGNSHYKKPPYKTQKDNKEHWTSFVVGKYLAYTTQNLSMIGGGILLGWILDKTFGTAPLFLILCIFCGAAGGFYYLVSSLNSKNKKPDD